MAPVPSRGLMDSPVDDPVDLLGGYGSVLDQCEQVIESPVGPKPEVIGDLIRIDRVASIDDKKIEVMKVDCAEAASLDLNWKPPALQHVRNLLVGVAHVIAFVSRRSEA